MAEYRKPDEIKRKLDVLNPLPKEAMGNPLETSVLNRPNHPGAIGSNTQTLKKSRVISESVPGSIKSARENLEIFNYRDAANYVKELANKNEPLSERQIKSIHWLVLKQIDDQNAGSYRTYNVYIKGANHEPPDAARVPSKMRQFIEWYGIEAHSFHSVARAAFVHAEFVKIHPFADGNGRTARLLMNLELMKSHFPPIEVPVESRLTYCKALDTAHTQGDYEPFLRFVIGEVEKSFHLYRHCLGVTP